MQQRAAHEQQPDELIWWVVSDGELVWWLAGSWHSPESAPGYAPPAPLANRAGSGTAVLAFGIILTLAGLVPLLLFISWALTPV